MPRRTSSVAAVRCVALTLGALAPVACAGSSGGLSSATSSITATATPGVTPTASSPAGGGSGQASSATFNFTWPARKGTQQSVKQRMYISPSISSLSVAIDGAAPIVENAPVPTGSPQTITYTIPISVGTHALTISEYDARSRLLGQGARHVTIVQDAANVIDFTLNGNLAMIAIVQATSPFLEGSLASGFTLVGDGAQTFTEIPEDADGNPITTPGLIPAITTKSASPAAMPVSDLGSDTFTLAAPNPTAFVTITASGTDLSGNTINATLKANAVEAFYIANFTTQTINVYDNTGTQLSPVAVGFAGLSNPSGITYVKSGQLGVPGTLVVTQVADSSDPAVLEFDTQGNAKTLSGSAFAGTAEPVFAGYGGMLAVPNESSNTITTYDLAGDVQSTGAFAQLDRPIGVAYDAHDSNYYVTSLGSAKLGRYTTTGSAVGAPVAAGNATEGIAYDDHNNELYVLIAGTQPLVDESGKPLTVGPQLAGVDVFSEAPALVSQSTGTFTPPKTTAFYEDIVFDPADKDLYITDAGDDEVVAFTESGSSVTLPAGSFGSLSDPMGIAVVP